MIYIYIYIYTHIHAHTHAHCLCIFVTLWTFCLVLFESKCLFIMSLTSDDYTSDNVPMYRKIHRTMYRCIGRTSIGRQSTDVSEDLPIVLRLRGIGRLSDWYPIDRTIQRFRNITVTLPMSDVNLLYSSTVPNNSLHQHFCQVEEKLEMSILYY